MIRRRTEKLTERFVRPYKVKKNCINKHGQIRTTQYNKNTSSSQLWLINILRYCSSSWLILSVCSSIQGQNTINNLLFIPSISFNSLINPTVNQGPLSKIMLSSNPCNFHMLFLNSLVNSSADIFSVVGMKCTIFVSLSTTTKIESYP